MKACSVLGSRSQTRCLGIQPSGETAIPNAQNKPPSTHHVNDFEIPKRRLRSAQKILFATLVKAGKTILFEPGGIVVKEDVAAIPSFPHKYFLENMAVRGDNSILVTVMNHQELWYIPPSSANVPVDPVLLYTFAQPTMAIVEVEPDIFYICTSNLYTSHESYLHRLDMRNWTTGKSVNPEVVVEFPEPVRGLNGGCLIAPNILFIADCFASLIWRVDLPPGGGKVTVRVWLRPTNPE